MGRKEGSHFCLDPGDGPLSAWLRYRTYRFPVARVERPRVDIRVQGAPVHRAGGEAGAVRRRKPCSDLSTMTPIDFRTRRLG